jgi:hypothetical protein
MIFLPIVDRELRVASRRSATYWSRSQAAFATLVPAFFLLTMPVSIPSLAQRGAQLFQILAYITFLGALVSAVRLTSDCLSGEKRDGTLGFLFLTDLKPYDVVFGKLAATSLPALYGLLAVVPVLAIPILLGGVTLADVLRLALVLANTLFFSLALAMFISALCWSEKVAAGVSILLLVAFGAALPLTGITVTMLTGKPSVLAMLLTASPGFACGTVSSAMYVGARTPFWVSVAVTHLLGWLFIALTCRVLPHVGQERPAEGRRLRWREWCRRVLLGGREARIEFRRRLLAVNPVYWLASRERRTVWNPWILLLSLAAIGAWACWSLRPRSVQFEPLLFFCFCVNWFYKHWIANTACFAFSTDRDNGATELLLCTPLTIQDVLRGHALALRRQFLFPVLALLIIELCLFAIALATDIRGAPSPLLPLLFLAMPGVFVADIFAAVWVGWWAGIVSKNASSASSTVYVRVMLLPWAAVFAGLILIGLTFGLDSESVGPVAGFLWVGASLCADWVFARGARRRLLTDLRAAVAERYAGDDPGLRGWRRLGRRLGEWFAGSRAR